MLLLPQHKKKLTKKLWAPLEQFDFGVDFHGLKFTSAAAGT